MDDIQIKSELIEQLIEISKEAGKAILEVYKTNFDYQIKEDLSPLTEADTRSNNIICERLKVLTPNIPILSEENSDVPFNIRSQWNQYWLIDPLDGTKEFIKQNGEFTVNIALIKNNTPILGIINVPATGETYWGSEENGSYYSSNDISKKKISVSKNLGDPIRVVTSRSHKNANLENLLKNLDKYKLVRKGSSLKFCLIATGEADVYPRFGTTSEWDIAAGEAIVKFAGGYIVTVDNQAMKYNTKENLLNSYFIASSNRTSSENLLSLIK